MKGVVFNLLEEVVTQHYGEAIWDELLEAAQLEGAYTSLGSYPDEEFLKLVQVASRMFQQPADEVIRWFGGRALGLLAGRYPQFFEPHTATRSFLLTLNDVIHPEVRKLYPGAQVPEFRFDTTPEGALVIGYSSQRKLCAFAEGLIQGAGERFGERVVVEQPQCMKRGDARCLLVCSFQPLREAAV